MKTTIIEIPYEFLQMLVVSSVCFPAEDSIARELSYYSMSVSGIIVVEYANKTVATAKFTFSPQGLDGNLEMISGDYNSNSYLMKQAIVNYTLLKKRN